MRTGSSQLPLRGGKDGTPHPVDRTSYDRTIVVLHSALNRAKVDSSEKADALKRLSRFVDRVTRDSNTP